MYSGRVARPVAEGAGLNVRLLVILAWRDVAFLQRWLLLSLGSYGVLCRLVSWTSLALPPSPTATTRRMVK